MGPLEPETDYLFRLEVEGGPVSGTSNILWYPNFENNEDIDFESGGNRDDDNYGDQGRSRRPLRLSPARGYPGSSGNSSGGSGEDGGSSGGFRIRKTNYE